MYRPASFREDRLDVLVDMIRAHPLGSLVTHGQNGLSANAIPFIAVVLEGRVILRAHLARANPQLDDLRDTSNALVIFHGPQAYVSPSWYPEKKEHGRVVPTWNYVMVQAHGRPTVIDDPGWIRAQIDALTLQQEKDRATPWSAADAPTTYIASQLKAIVGIELQVDRLEGKWKVSQNHPPGNRRGVIEGLRADEPSSPMAAIVDERGR